MGALAVAGPPASTGRAAVPSPWPTVHFAGEDDIVFPAGRMDRILDDFEIVLSLGEGVTLEAAGRRHPVGRGDAFVLRPGEPHALVFDGARRVRLLFCHHRWEGLDAGRGSDLQGAGWAPPDRQVPAVGRPGPTARASRPTPSADPWNWPTYVPAGSHTPRLATCLRDVLTALWQRTGPWQWEASVALLGAAAVFERVTAAAPPVGAPGPGDPPPARAARAFIEGHLECDLRGLVAAAARDAGLSVSQINRVFHAAYGMSPQRWINGLRLTRASIALVQRGADVATAARAAGVSDVRYFSRFFRRHTGLTPSAYRARYAGRWCTGVGVPAGLPNGGDEPSRLYPCNVHLPGS